MSIAQTTVLSRHVCVSLKLFFFLVYNLRNHDGIFEDPQSIDSVSQGCKHPLETKTSDTKWNDEEGKHDCSNVQPVAPITKIPL